MALISISFAISLLTYHLLQKLNVYEKVAFWLVFRKLQYFTPPSKDDLKAASGIADVKHKGNKKHRRQQDYPEFEKVLVPKAVDIDLVKSDLFEVLIAALHYFTELKWLLNVSVTAIIAYALTEFYYFVKDLAMGGKILLAPGGTVLTIVSVTFTCACF